MKERKIKPKLQRLPILPAYVKATTTSENWDSTNCLLMVSVKTNLKKKNITVTYLNHYRNEYGIYEFRKQQDLWLG